MYIQPKITISSYIDVLYIIKPPFNRSRQSAKTDCNTVELCTSYIRSVYINVSNI